MYYPLHVHTAFGSIGDSILKIEDYVKRAKEYGLNTLAITDHGSMSAMYSFAEECLKNDIKPIIGMEGYIYGEWMEELKIKYCHILFLAKNEKGLRNLLKIHNYAATDGFRNRKPCTDIDHLREYGEGIIATSACVGGEISKLVANNRRHQAVELIREYKNIFDEYLLEIQPGTFTLQIDTNDAIVSLSEETDTRIVVTNDIHYLNPEDAKIHDYHVKLGRRNYISEDYIYPDTCYWFMNEEALRKNFVYTEKLTPEIVDKALDTAKDIADVCNVALDMEIHMPQAIIPEHSSEKTELYEACFDGFKKIVQKIENPFEYVDRLRKELNVIEKKGFCGYFLVVKEYVNWARENGVPVGPGRGSAAGSLVAYVLGITQVDPIKYGLLFERFLDEKREAIPDIDVDFSTSSRDKMFEHMTQRYGKEYCSLVSTFHVRKTKGALRDAARVLNYEPSVGNMLAKMIPERYYGDDGEKKTELSVHDTLQISNEFRKAYRKFKDVIDLADKLSGYPSSAGLHPAGILLSPIPLTDRLPLIKSNREFIQATSLNLNDAEHQFVKFDYLGISTLSVLDNTEKDANFIFDYGDETLLNDEATWNLISSQDTTGLFQLGSSIYKKRMPKLHPRTIEELAACLALLRGPCISSKMDDLYIQIVNGKKEIEKIHPLYDKVTENTNGILLYQEQIMQLAVAFGMDLSTGYRIVKLSAKKKMDKLAEYRGKFVELALAKSCSSETANRIFDLIVKSAEYSFNKSHAVAYALLSYKSAYLKAHYPLEYMKNLLTDEYVKGEDGNYDSIYIECEKFGIEFLPCDINKSKWGFSVEDKKIRMGFCSVKGLGEKAARTIMNNRIFTSLDDLLDKVKNKKIDNRALNKKGVNTLIFSGCLDSIKPEKTRWQICEEYMRSRKETLENELKITPDLIVSTTDTNEILLRKFSQSKKIHL